MEVAAKNLHRTEADKYHVHLPYGLIGLQEMRQFDVAPIPGTWPLLAMRSTENDAVCFAVVEPYTLVGGYNLDLNDDDVEQLRLQSATDVLIFNIVTIHSLRPQYVTVNLVGPIVVNRHTLIGKQIIIGNFEQYSTQHVLIDERGKDSAN
jgi:flagellar assembly factor FliW